MKWTYISMILSLLRTSCKKVWSPVFRFFMKLESILPKSLLPGNFGAISGWIFFNWRSKWGHKLRYLGEKLADYQIMKIRNTKNHQIKICIRNGFYLVSEDAKFIISTEDKPFTTIITDTYFVCLKEGSNVEWKWDN